MQNIRHSGLFAYYAVLTTILILWGDPLTLPALPLRIAFLFMVVTPIFVSARESFLVVFFFFVILSGSNHAVSYMPATGPSILICAIAGAVFFRPQETRRLSLPNGVLPLFLLVTFIDLIAGGRVENVSYALLLAIIVSCSFMLNDRKRQIEDIAYSFIIISLLLSIEYFFWGNQSSATVLIDDKDYNRIGWADPNYFSCVLGFGALISYTELIRPSFFRRSNKVILVLTLLLSLYVIIATASRGATLAIAVAFILATMLSSMSLGRKAFIVAVFAVLLLLSFRLGYFDLLFSRVVNDDGTAGDRTLIWTTKMKAFTDSDIVHVLFGYGLKEGRLLGFAKNQGFHNDYLAFLVSYGMIGFILFSSIWVSLFRNMGKSLRVSVPYISYVLVICISLEPISSGYLIYFYFILFILLIKECFRE